MRFITPEEAAQITPLPNPWPLRFESFTMGFRYWNIQRCSILYDGREQSVCTHTSCGPPYGEQWKRNWRGDYGFFYDFPPPVQVRWTSLDGQEHHAAVDLAEIFKDRQVLHNLKREEVKEGTAHHMNVDILLEVNDRTINVYMKAMVIGKELEDPSNPYSAPRFDLMLAWTHTY